MADAQHYECRPPLGTPEVTLAYSGMQRHATERSGIQRSAKGSAKNPRCKCGEARPEMFARKARHNGRIGYQHACKPCMVAKHRAWRAKPEGRAKMRAGVKASRERYPEKQRARAILMDAVRRGVIQRGPCYVAGPECRGGIEGHHHDYNKPLEPTWTCRKHHRALDRARRDRDKSRAADRKQTAANFMELVELVGLMPKGSTKHQSRRQPSASPAAPVPLPRRGGRQ